MTKPVLPEDFQFNTNTFYRYGEKESLWAIGKEWIYKGNVYQCIVYGDWKQSTSDKWLSYDQKNTSTEFKKHQTEALKEIQLIVNGEREKKNKECVEKWLPIFNETSSESNIHPYMLSKGLTSNYLGRVSRGMLMIPALDHNGFTGLQLIFKTENEFIKRFTTGIKKKGSIAPINDDYRTAEYVMVTEGYATAASVYEATGIPTVSAFDCGNLQEAIRTIRHINPTCKITICADDDKSGIGAKKAYQCRAAFINVIVKKPKFTFKSDSLTDFNDLHMTEGPDVVKEQLNITESDFIKISILGSFGSSSVKYFYFSSMSNRIYQLSASEHNKNNLLQMAPKKYWGQRYGFSKDKDGVPTDSPMWNEISGHLFVEQAMKGFFDPRNIRGVGPWIDNKRFIYNLGDKILMDGEIVSTVPDSKFMYQSSSEITLASPASIEDCQEIISTFYNLSYRNKEDFYYLCGWIAMAPIFNYVDWRPHIWLTGPRGSGKSSILKMISKLAGDGTVYQSVTAAAIRQSLKHDAIAMIIDEAEPNSKEANRRMDEIIEVIRQCSSNMITKSIRGSSTGDAIEYNVNSCFLLSSIQTYLPTEADRSRFFQIELTQSDNYDMWKAVQHQFTKVEHMGPNLMSRMINMAPIVRHNIRVFRDLLLTNDDVKEARMADQIGTSMGCYSAMLYDHRITKEEAEILLMTINLKQSDYVENNESDESDECLNAMMDTIINKNDMKTVRQYYDDSSVHVLKSLGLMRKGNHLYISNKNVEMQKIMDAAGYSNYIAILRRHKHCVDRSIVMRVDTISARYVKIKIG